MRYVCILTNIFQVVNKSDIEPATSNEAIIYGMFLNGAKWNQDFGILEEQDYKITSYEMSFIKIIPTAKQNLIKDNRYECPLYITSARRGALYSTGYSKNFVISILLPTALPPKHWIKRSVAMICQLN